MTEAPGSSPPEPGPEPSPSSPPTGPVSGEGSGLPENVAGTLSYLLGPITGVLFFIIDRDRDFVRFHAVQAIGVTVVWVVLSVVLAILGVVLGFVPILGWLIGALLSLGLTIGGFALWLWLMYQAYQGNTWELPGLGPHVRRIAADTGGQAPAGPAA